MPFNYPEARRDDSVSDDYKGKQVPDPYRWLEDPDADETKSFVDAQNAITVPFVSSFSAKEKLKNRITEMWDYPKYSAPFKRGKRYFYHYNTGLQNQSVMYVQDSLSSEPRVFLDPNELSDDGTTALRSSAFSEDGNVFAYCLSEKGSDWVTVKFRDVATGEDLADVLKNVKFSCLDWTHDHKGVFYNSYPVDGKADGSETTSNYHQKLYYHRLGEDQTADTLCAEFPDNPQWMGGVEISDCGSFAVLSISEGCKPANRLYICDLNKLENGISGLLPFVKIVDDFEAEYEYITNEGSVLTFKTNLNAPRYKLINIDLENHEMSNWKTLIPEHEKDVLDWSACVNQNKLVMCYMHDVKSSLYLHDLKSGERLMEFPLDVGSVVGYSGRKKDDEIFYKFMSFLTPGRIYRCDLSKGKLEPEVFRDIEVKGFDASKFETSQVFYKSKDGTSIPMFIVHRKGITLNGSNPVLLYGYGGFNIAITPSFSVTRITFMQNLGGIVCVANIRGGGEYGENWHKAGIEENKQNVFDDFCAAAEYLVAEKYTKPELISIMGGSNGGLLVGACANQRPDLFGCVISQVGVMDMLRFNKFTIGHAWTTDFGNPDEDGFEYIYKYSPLHNIRLPEGDGVQYPSTLLLTADHDDRVVPLHSLKFIAQLQHVFRNSPSQQNPLMIRVDTKAGHGMGKPTAKVIEEATETYSFIALACGLSWMEDAPVA
ncbi:prolyl endopeptidase-like [Lineus longissimus]|uniref:prolyl endopeptidase-like n=1 Tax=Lineus longissimus TaxID=88925 RepID=UPI002B4CC6B3